MIEYCGDVKNNIYYQGYLILKEIQNFKNHIFLTDLYLKLKKNKHFNDKDFFSALVFIYSIGTIKFRDGYIWIE